MVTAGGQVHRPFRFGDVEQFHTLMRNGRIFRLFDVVTIKTKDYSWIAGKIGYISEKSVDILPEHGSAKTVKLEDIESIF